METLNQETAPSVESNPDELIDTVDTPIPVPAEEPLKPDEKTEEGKKEVEEGKKEVKPDKDDLRFDKHPRFQQMLKTQNDLKAELKALKEEPVEKDYKDIRDMTEEELLEMSDNPKEYQENLRKQITAEVTRDITESLSAKMHEEKVLSTFDKYVEENDSFNEMWESGEIQKFMNDNPGHNSISAHMAMTAEDKQAKAIEEAVAKAIKETEEKVIKNFKAKKGAKVLSEGSSTTGTSQTIAPELKDPKKFGGINTVLAARLKARRQAV